MPLRGLRVFVRCFEMKPYISVIIPIYKTDLNTLKRSIESVTSQALSENVELCLIFDGNSELSESEFISQVSARTQIKIISKNHEGVSAARNAGINFAEGEWILFVDVDDMLPGDTINSLYPALNQFNADVVFGNYLVQIGETGSVQAISRITQQQNISDLKLIQEFAHRVLDMKERFGVVWAAAFRRSFLLQNGIRFNTKLEIAEDTEFVLKTVLNAKSIVFTKDAIYTYIRNMGSTVLSFNIEYPQRVINAITEIRQLLIGRKIYDQYEKDVGVFAINHLTLLLVHYICNIQSGWSEKMRYEKYMELCDSETFKSCMNVVSYSDFSPAKAIALFSLKHHIYPLSRLIGYTRSKQLN